MDVIHDLLSQIMDIPEVLKFLGISRQRLNELDRNGKLKPIKKGIYLREDVENRKKEQTTLRDKYVKIRRIDISNDLVYRYKNFFDSLNSEMFNGKKESEIYDYFCSNFLDKESSKLGIHPADLYDSLSLKTKLYTWDLATII